jgi:DNA-binding GntR family transcriptional regulator
MIESTLARGRALRHDIADALRDEILDGRLEPGERVLETGLARRFGVSRQPVREAIRTLEREGLLTSLPNRGTFVTRVSYEDAIAIQDIRAQLEGLAARLAVEHLTTADFKRLRELHTAMRDAAKRGASHELVALDLEFHNLINTRSEHRLLLEVLGTVGVYTRGFVVHTRSYYARQADLQFVASSHALLLQALQTREPEQAERAVHTHIQSALASLTAAYADTPPPPRTTASSDGGTTARA